MTTITLWLLVTVGHSNTQAMVIERFATHQDCEEVRISLPIPTGYIGTPPNLSKCIQAKVVK